MIFAIAFTLLSIPIVFISWKSFKKIGSHGFFRFFCWEAMLVLLVFRIEFWLTNPFFSYQIISWLMLFIAIWFVITGVMALKRKGNQTQNRNKPELFSFEKTSQVIDSGIFKYIRHPMYSSLLFLTWAIYLKNPDWILFPVAVFSSIFLFLMAKADENECIEYFGDDYKKYMKKSTRFIPFVF